MTVKLAKFFSGNSNHNSNNNNSNSMISTNGGLHAPTIATAVAATTTPTITTKATPTPYVGYADHDDIDDDNMSLYSTTAAAIMTSRDHPYNSSQRPLLGDRKTAAPPPPPARVLLLNKKKQFNTNQMQQQQQQKLYISTSYAQQQQKRDSARGLHGFNDFDILSQQYNQHLQSPHIGYPYGSPPSPIANSSDFVFDTLTIAAAPPAHRNICHYADTSTVAATPQFRNDINEVNYYANATTTAPAKTKTHANANATTMNGFGAGKSSRFEDDFCCRRNASFASSKQRISPSQSPAPPLPPQVDYDTVSGHGGPFIFGVPHEQQSNLRRMPPGGRGFNDSPIATDADDNNTPVINGMSHLSEKLASSVSSASSAHFVGPAAMQSTSDTSTSTSSSRDCSGTSNTSNSSSNSKGARKFLLRKRKAKKLTKDKPTKARTFNGNKPTIKCVVVGDGAVGKTNLIRTYLENRFNPEHVPTASDIYNAEVMVNDSPVHLTLCDTAGQDTLDPLRELCYPDSDVFLLCFSVARPETFHAIKTKWAPKFSKTKAALILVGTQADLRTNANVLNKLQSNGEKPVAYADAWDLAMTIGAKYIETSSFTQDKVKEVFDTAIWEGLVPNTLPPTPPSFWRKLFCLA